MELTPDQARSARTVDVSFALDGDRHRASLTEHSATALRRRALAAGNGHGRREDVIPARERER